MDIVSKIKAHGGYHRSRCGASDEQIASAEQTLGLKFPEEYKEIAKEFGHIYFPANHWTGEWTGFNINRGLDVVDATRFEQINDDRFPAGFFVLENTGWDGLLVVANSVGQVYGYCEGSLTFWNNSISEYFDYCIHADA